MPPKRLPTAQLRNPQERKKKITVRCTPGNRQQNREVEENCSLQDQNLKQIAIPVMPMKPFSMIICITLCLLHAGYVCAPEDDSLTRASSGIYHIGGAAD